MAPATGPGQAMPGRGDMPATGEAPLARRLGAAESADAETPEELAAHVPFVGAAAGLSGAFGLPQPSTGDQAGAAGEGTAPWTSIGPPGETPHGIGGSAGGGRGPAADDDATGDDAALPFGRDQRRRHQEREFVRAVQRRLLEERERMGGLGGLIR